ncbi:Uncharacterised protein [Mycobacteroides abscessus subsp. abscessus]|nr:Uncharacterised protein [Mycobacteroides abscessus subsp. abscessus]
MRPSYGSCTAAMDSVRVRTMCQPKPAWLTTASDSATPRTRTCMQSAA